MKYIEEKGTVTGIEGETATVRLDNKIEEDCGSCCACSAFQSGESTIDLPKGNLQEGDRVQVRVPRVNPFLSMLLIFGLPLALFMGGIAIGQNLQGGERIGSISAMGGIAGLILAFLIAWLMNHMLSRNAVPEAEKISP